MLHTVQPGGTTGTHRAAGAESSARAVRLPGPNSARTPPAWAGPGRYGVLMSDADVVIWYNPRCSKCRGADELLAAHGVPAQRLLYLDDPPPRDEITRVLALLGAADPRALMRTSEPRYRELGLA